jgi:hypothetical protein
MAQETPLLVDHRSSAGPSVIEVRGSLIVSSLQTLRERDMFERYEQGLPAEHRDTILYALAASWMPLDVVMIHYGACEAIGLSDQELEANGEHVSRRIMGTFLGTITRASRSAGAGVSPLVALNQYGKLWDRLLRGGGVTVRQTGPKDVIVESRGVPMFRYRYFRVAYAGLVRGACLMFSKTCYVRSRRASDDALSLSVSWV